MRTEASAEAPDRSRSRSRDLTTVSRGAATSLIGTGLATLSGLVVTMMLTRGLGVGGYGTIVVATSVIVLVQSVGNLGVSQATARMISLARAEGDERRAQRLLKASLLSGLGTGLVGVGVMLGIAWAGVVGDRDTSLVLAIMSPLVVLGGLRGAVYGALRAYRDLRSVLALQVAGPVMDVAVIGLLMAAGVRSMAVFAVAFVAVAAGELGFASGLLVRRRPLGPLLDTTRTDFKALIAFSLPLVVTQIFYSAISSIDVMLLGFLDSRDSAGLYAPVMRVASSSTMVLAAFPLLFVPVATAYVVGSRTSEIKGLYIAVTKWAYLVGFPVVLALVVAPAPILTILFGERYAETESLARILALGYWVVLITGLNGVTLGVVGLVKQMAVISGFGFLVTIAVGVPLVSSLGPNGAAMTNTISYSFANILFSLLLFRRTHVSPFRHDSSRLFVYSGIVLVVATLVAELVAPRGGTGALVVAAIGIVCWLVGGGAAAPFAMEWSEMRGVVSRANGRRSTGGPGAPVDELSDADEPVP